MRGMSLVRTGDVSPQMIVLGLVVQRADTVAGINRRLVDQFATARFAKGAAHGNLPSLAEKGYVRLVQPGPPGEPTRDRYEATASGRELFASWLHGSALPVMVRDVMQCKLELMEPDDLPALLRTIRELEESFTAMCDVARVRVLRQQRLRRARDGAADWRERLGGIQAKDEANLWGLMAQRLERLGEDLEELLDEVSGEAKGR